MGEPPDCEAPPSRVLLGSRPIRGLATCAWLSSEANDQPWDDFLRATPLGQFQQSSLWAQAKESDGWRSHRVVLAQEERIVGGFQILWRCTHLGRIGYISKGPVLPAEHPETLAFALEILHDSVQSMRLAALAVQPPDLSRELVFALAGRGFARNYLMDIISASCWVQLAGSPGQWEKRISRSRKVDVRQAIRRGVAVREGDDADVARFFEFMACTCARHGVKPNPSSTKALGQLVGAFRATGESRLSFAECAGEAVACVLDLKFGERVTTWKKGWNGAFADRHPNVLLAYESLRWAHSRGCKYLDFAGMDRDLAECMLAQRPLTEKQKRSRDTFNLQFGAEPRLLPPALIFWPNRVLRFIYAGATASPKMAGAIGRIARRMGAL